MLSHGQLFFQDFNEDGAGMKTVIKIGTHSDRIEHHMHNHSSSSNSVDGFLEAHSVPTTPTPLDNRNQIQLRSQRSVCPVERRHNHQALLPQSSCFDLLPQNKFDKQ
jgi:hypothetical protein